MLYNNLLILRTGQQFKLFYATWRLSNGRIIGAVLIIAGLYFVLYGKSEERKFAALEKAEIQTIVEHGIERVPVSRGSIKSSITVPLLHQSTDNV